MIKHEETGFIVPAFDVERFADGLKWSPTYKLIQKLEELGAEVAYHDPHVPVVPMTREHAEYAGRESVAEVTDDHDLILLSTGHEEYKSLDFSDFQTPFVDTRNAVDPAKRPAKYHQA